MGDSESVPMIEQLVKAFEEFEKHKQSLPDFVVLWKEIEEYFSKLQDSLKKRDDELSEREKMLEDRESKTNELLEQRETEVASKEKAMLDRLQELKDAAVAAITDAHSKYKITYPEPINMEEDPEKKVSTFSSGDDQLSAPEEKSPDKSTQHPEGVAAEVRPRPDLRQYCEQMDIKGLLKYISENKKDLSAIREEMPFALKSAPEPAHLVLDSLEGFYPQDLTSLPGNNREIALTGLRRSCVFLMESLAPLLLGAQPGSILSSEMKQQAKAIADEWKSKLSVVVELDATNESPLETQAFLQLLATFGIASDFDEDELCKLVLAVSQRRQTPELCRSLGLTHKIPGIVESLVNSGRHIEAVHFVQTFQLGDRFSSVELLKAYLKDLHHNSQDDSSAQELSALKSVVKCIEEFKLEADYPLSPLQKRVVQLEKAKTEKRRNAEHVKPHARRPRGAGAFVSGRTQPPPPAFHEWGGYREGMERHPYTAPTTYDYGPANQPTYGQQINMQHVQQPYYYQDGRTSIGAPGVPSNYARYSGSEYQTSGQSYYYQGEHAPTQQTYYYQSEQQQTPVVPPGVSTSYSRYTGSGWQPHN